MIGGPKRTPSEWAVMVIACVMATISAGLGLSLLISPAARFAAASFDPIREVAPLRVWGAAFLIAGTAAVLGQTVKWFRAVALAHACCGFMALFWSGAFVTGLGNPNASTTGIWAYLGIGLTHWVVVAVALVESRWRGV